MEVPDDLATALAGDASAGAAFAQLSYTHRREYVEWVTEAKREQPRRRRIEKTLSRLSAGEP